MCQVVVPGEVWFAQRIEEGVPGSYCLTGVTVAPGWDLQVGLAHLSIAHWGSHLIEAPGNKVTQNDSF